MSQAVFISHSHRDQNEAYALSEWVYRALPASDVGTYISDRSLSWREELLANSYLQILPHIDVVLGLLSQHSMTSNAVFHELDVAVRARKPILLACRPQMDKDDRRVYSYLKGLWEPKYGRPVDFATGDADSELRRRLCKHLRRAVPAGSPPDLTSLVKKKRALPKREDIPMPDLSRITRGRATREEAIAWLAMLEREVDHRMLSRGLEPPSRDSTSGAEERTGEFLLSCGSEWWPEVTVQLRPLLDSRLTTWLKGQRHQGERGSQATALLRYIS